MFLLVPCCAGARAETFKSTDPGRGRMDVTGMWQFHTGDNLAWANPAFDDSGWESISGDEPWGSQGHPGYRGYAWYRKRIEIGPGGTPLGLRILQAQGAYEVYWNGNRIGASGSLPPHARWYLLGQELVFDLHATSPVSGVVALRFWLPPPATTADSSEGGLVVPPAIGSKDLLNYLQEASSAVIAQLQLPGIIASSLILTAGLLSLVLFLRKRGQWLYLWLAMLLLGEGPEGLQFLFIENVSFVPNQFIIQAMEALQAIGLWLILLTVFGLNRSRRWRAVTAIIIAAYVLSQLIDLICMMFWQDAGPGLIRTDALATQMYTALEFYLLLLVGFGLARSRSWPLVPLGVIAVVCGAYSPAINLILLINPANGRALPNWAVHIWGYDIYSSSILDWLLITALIVTVAVLQMREARRQTHLEAEMRSAQEVQQVLIPAEIPSIPGLTVSSVYKPAAEVGGDFFQVIPPTPDDPLAGALIVVGDVSGKGLKAAMTVSLIVGTVRTLAESTRSPAAILSGLNRRLLGRIQNGFVTCLITHIDSNGNGVMANAGHLSPYRDEKEWEVPASLPLGLSSLAEYDEVRVHLKETETLTFLTDGVLEARNQKGQLYGFERLAELMNGRPTAEQVADAACRFGQEDDITVLSVTREPTREPMLSMIPEPLPAVG
ncbi:MAG: SpoIIE family protein phosphatase [Terracidiphilus sp.]